MARRQMSMGKFKNLVRSAVAVKHNSRIRLISGAVTQAATTHFNLLTCDDDPAYDNATDGTNVAECQPLTRLHRIDLRMFVQNSGSLGLTPYEMILYKDPDGELGALAPSDLFGADVTEAREYLRKNTLAYDAWLQSNDFAGSTRRIRVSRAAIKRAGVFHDGDIIKLGITSPSSGVNGVLHLIGKIRWG